MMLQEFIILIIDLLSIPDITENDKIKAIQETIHRYKKIINTLSEMETRELALNYVNDDAKLFLNECLDYYEKNKTLINL